MFDQRSEGVEMLRKLGVATLLCVAALACSKQESPSSAPGAATPAATPTPAPAAPVAAAAIPADPKELFKARCVMCHGESGKGDGPAAAALTPKPRDYTDAVWQKSVSDEQIKKTITGGGASVGKSPLMPAQPDLANNPAALDGLVKVIRGFAS
jgi:mono/diheme cytochrome c family protein